MSFAGGRPLDLLVWFSNFPVALACPDSNSVWDSVTALDMARRGDVGVALGTQIMSNVTKNTAAAQAQIGWVGTG